MSWSVGGVGKAHELAAELARQFAAAVCDGNEEVVRKQAAATIDLALSSMPVEAVVAVRAAGNTSIIDRAEPKKGRYNILQISIRPMG